MSLNILINKINKITAICSSEFTKINLWFFYSSFLERSNNQLLYSLVRWSRILCLMSSLSTRFFRLQCPNTEATTTQLYTRIPHYGVSSRQFSANNTKHKFIIRFLSLTSEKAGIAPLLDVEDMVIMKKPDWKCVFTYVQSIHRRFRNVDWRKKKFFFFFLQILRIFS